MIPTFELYVLSIHKYFETDARICSSKIASYLFVNKWNYDSSNIPFTFVCIILPRQIMFTIQAMATVMFN